jgi:hypothetical protein
MGSCYLLAFFSVEFSTRTDVSVCVVSSGMMPSLPPSMTDNVLTAFLASAALAMAAAAALVSDAAAACRSSSSTAARTRSMNLSSSSGKNRPAMERVE